MPTTTNESERCPKHGEMLREIIEQDDGGASVYVGCLSCLQERKADERRFLRQLRGW